MVERKSRQPRIDSVLNVLLSAQLNPDSVNSGWRKITANRLAAFSEKENITLVSKLMDTLKDGEDKDIKDLRDAGVFVLRGFDLSQIAPETLQNMYLDRVEGLNPKADPNGNINSHLDVGIIFAHYLPPTLRARTDVRKTWETFGKKVPPGNTDSWNQISTKIERIMQIMENPNMASFIETEIFVPPISPHIEQLGAVALLEIKPAGLEDVLLIHFMIVEDLVRRGMTRAEIKVRAAAHMSPKELHGHLDRIDKEKLQKFRKMKQ